MEKLWIAKTRAPNLRPLDRVLYRVSGKASRAALRLQLSAFPCFPPFDVCGYPLSPRASCTLDAAIASAVARAILYRVAPATDEATARAQTTYLSYLVAPGGSAQAADPDWRRLGDEAADVLSDVIRIDTQNPPGGETAAANALARKLGAEGIAADVIESGPDRGNLHALLAGSGRGRPIILLAHLDVVPADPRAWRVPPLGGVREHGYVYGRGALDAKGVAVAELMTLVALKRAGETPARDIVFLATADEETGGKAGAGWIVEHRPDLLHDAEYLLTEGDHVRVGPGGRKVVQVA